MIGPENPIITIGEEDAAAGFDWDSPCDKFLARRYPDHYKALNTNHVHKTAVFWNPDARRKMLDAIAEPDPARAVVAFGALLGSHLQGRYFPIEYSIRTGRPLKWQWSGYGQYDGALPEQSKLVAFLDGGKSRALVFGEYTVIFEPPWTRYYEYGDAHSARRDLETSEHPRVWRIVRTNQYQTVDR